MIAFTRHDQRVPDHGELPPPMTWGPPSCTTVGTPWEHDLALVTCARQHTCRITARVHSIAPDGTLRPSYVCPVTGCDFHAFVRLEGWSP